MPWSISANCPERKVSLGGLAEQVEELLEQKKTTVERDMLAHYEKKVKAMEDEFASKREQMTEATDNKVREAEREVTELKRAWVEQMDTEKAKLEQLENKSFVYETQIHAYAVVLDNFRDFVKHDYDNEIKGFKQQIRELNVEIASKNNQLQVAALHRRAMNKSRKESRSMSTQTDGRWVAESSMHEAVLAAERRKAVEVKSIMEANRRLDSKLRATKQALVESNDKYRVVSDKLEEEGMEVQRAQVVSLTKDSEIRRLHEEAGRLHRELDRQRRQINSQSAVTPAQKDAASSSISIKRDTAEATANDRVRRLEKELKEEKELHQVTLNELMQLARESLK